MANSRCKLWMDVEDGWAGWFRTPNSGADASPVGWGADGTFLNGGGYAQNSFGSHKRYQYAWPDSSTRQEAQFMKSLSDGTYGRGLIHFVEPTIYDQNILSARVANPSIAVDDEGATMVYGQTPLSVPTSNWQANLLPATSARYDLTNVPAGYRGIADSVYVPIPEGHTLFMGAFYSTTGAASVYARTILADGSVGEDVPLTKINNTDPFTTVDSFSEIRGIRLWIGKTNSRVATITITALIARLIRTESILVDGAGYEEGNYGEEPYGGVIIPDRIISAPWVGGMGHSGCRFVGKPTFVTNTGVNGGQVGFAATFQEVGSHLYG